MNRVTPLSATADLAVNRFDHPLHEVHQDPEREVADHWGLAFVEAGTFEISCEGHHAALAVGSMLLTRPGLEFSCRHGAACPEDICLAVRFEPGALSGMTDAWFRPGGLMYRRVSSRVAHVQQRLRRAVESGDSFETERWALAALHAVTDDARHSRIRGPYRTRTTDMDAVIAVCRDIEERPAIQQSVAERARSVQMTSTRLTHAFTRYVGMSPHQYVVRWRLGSACALLDEGASVSETCYRVGFENLSHFCRSFQRALGCRPSRWGTLPLPERRRKVQAMLGWRS